MCVCARANTPQGPLLFPASLYERRGSERAADVEECWPLWWQRLRLELKDMPGCPPPPPPPKPTHPPRKAAAPCPPTYTHSAPFAAALMEVIQATWSVCHLRILQLPKLPYIHPELWKSSKCVVCVWGGGWGAVQKSQANVPPPDILRGIYSHAYSSLLLWKFMHIHYFTWLKYPPKPIVSLRVQIQLVWSSDDGPLKVPHALVDSVSWFSCFPIQSVCVCLSQGNNHRRHPGG